MRMRIVLVVVGLAFTTMAIGQEPASLRAKPRTQVAKLRAEVELSQVEHDADVEHLRASIREARAEHPNRGNSSAISSIGRRTTPDEAREVQDRVKAEVFRKLDQEKAEFLDKTIAFNEKKLELVDLEQRLNASR